MPTPKKKITLDKLAVLINDGFEGVAKNIASTKQELNDNIEGLRADMNAGFEKISDERNYGPELDKLRGRVTRIEKHVGIEK